MDAIGPPQFTDLFVSAQDGLRLHAREYGPHTTAALPVVCLPGLTRTADDFHPLAVALACDPEHPRRVLALDYRGRGLSDYDGDPANYAITVEANDVVATIIACDIAPAVFVGTSRGGIITMMLAAARPSLIAGAVLNDIGPVIEIQGLMRIKSYVGKMPRPLTFDEGGEILRHLFGSQFTRLDSTDWRAAAQRAWKWQGNRLVPTYDVSLARTLDAIDPEQPMPSLWPQFEALAPVPLMVVRGKNSDLLSAATLALMRDRRWDMTAIEVADQGHAPLLADADTVGQIVAFVAGCDKSRS
jgi:pimeloyl-ACP methyl ester carboxylesterase